MDKFSQAKRSALMARVGATNTKPEITVRKILHGMGYRFRIHKKDLPGRPDISLPRYRTVVFVHGCFWHAHSCSKGITVPKSNTEFWLKKLEDNKSRDIRIRSELEALGWQVIVIWECETKSTEKVSEIISKALQRK